jgi:hypothetical protein
MRANQDFLTRLQQEANIQSKLNVHKILPDKLDTVTAFIGKHTIAVILFLSFFTALLIELI